MTRTFRQTPALIEGYAALFRVPDLVGDTVRAGAFVGLSAPGAPPVDMLLQHRPGAPVGRWLRLQEDATGLWVRGLVTAPAALARLGAGLDGLSIGFRARRWQPDRGGGRRLLSIDLVEVSLVSRPMQPLARLKRLTPPDVPARAA